MGHRQRHHQPSVRCWADESGNSRPLAADGTVDLEQAGIPYQDQDGLYADFHANRHTFISNLSRSGASPKMAQTLARHSDINLTMQTYTHVGINDQIAAISELPSPPTIHSQKNKPHEQRATGTERTACTNPLYQLASLRGTS
ncbi:MAG: tyrosine-type recombinase/integrase, partial [Planctomycetes bacterium]|nr:tyrosine-type recombinase/integrase [Planctomycetota bacterium]